VEGIIQQGDAAATAQGGVRLRSTWLVCTHGRRDRCCAQAGAAFVKAMAAVTPDDELWESSHLGGHRFAPSVLHLPSGVQYGRLREADAAALVEAHARDHVFDLAYYRGLTHLSREAQAAEAWLREHVGEPRIDGIQVLDEAQAAAGGQTTRLRTLDGQVHRVTVALRQGRFARLAGCDRDKPVLPEWFEPVRHEAYTSGP
jgi:hypothetical protein